MQIRYTIGTSRADDWICTSICQLSKPCLLQSSHVGDKHEREESNPVEQFWRLPALPGAHSCKSNGYPKGVEPLPPGSQPGMQRPLHHRHHISSSTRI